MRPDVVHLGDGAEGELRDVAVLVVEQAPGHHLQLLQLLALRRRPQPLQVGQQPQEADAHAHHRVLGQPQQRLVEVLLEEALRVEVEAGAAGVAEEGAPVAVGAEGEALDEAAQVAVAHVEAGYLARRKVVSRSTIGD